jgi:hypothetical protein
MSRATSITPRLTLAGVLATLLALVGCGSEGPGTVAVAVWGTEPAATGFPSGRASLADGWQIRFERWITAVAEVELTDPVTMEAVHAEPTRYLIDLAQAEQPAELFEATLDHGRYKFSFALVPAGLDAIRVHPVDEAIVVRMAEHGWNHYVEGFAERDDDVITFRWGFATAMHHGHCVNGLNGGDGVAVIPTRRAPGQIVLHVDRLFRDKLDGDTIRLRFDAIAGWRDARGEVALDDLAHVLIDDPRDREGAPIVDEDGERIFYDDAGLGYPNLRDFIVYAISQHAGFNGEAGECTRTPW